MSGVSSSIERPVDSLSFCSAATIAPSDGCEVMPDIESIAASTASAPACAAASIDATPVPAVSCVWMCSGSEGNSCRSAVTSCVAAGGLSSPAMSLMHSTWMSAATSARARSR